MRPYTHGDLLKLSALTVTNLVKGHFLEVKFGNVADITIGNFMINPDGTAPKPSAFDYVKYDAEGIQLQQYFKDKMIRLNSAVNLELKSPRAKALAITKLEETYMWIGKAIRDDQIVRNGSAPLQEERTNS